MIITPESLKQQFYENIKERLDKGSTRRGVSTGWHSLDEHMLLLKKHLFVLTGYPSYGKSEFLDALAVNTSHLHSWKWTFFSTENDSYATHLEKLVTKYLGKSPVKSFVKNIDDAIGWANRHYNWMAPGDKIMTLDDVISEASALIESGTEMDVLVIDPWNELNHTGQTKRDDQYIQDSMSKLRKFHKKYDVLSVVVVHPHSTEKDSKGNYPIPHLRTCAGGAMWWNKADYGVTVHTNDRNAHGRSVYIQKVKDDSIGYPGAIFLDWDPVSKRFKDQQAPSYDLPIMSPY